MLVTGVCSTGSGVFGLVTSGPRSERASCPVRLPPGASQGERNQSARCRSDQEANEELTVEPGGQAPHDNHYP